MSNPPSVPTASERVYHLELRHFPRNLCRFNLTEEELRATVLEPWVADRPFELGELRWDPRQARITVLEGPKLSPELLSMGRGWRTAQRQGRNVTEELLATVGETPAQGEGKAKGPPRSPAGGAERGRSTLEAGGLPAPTGVREPVAGGETGLMADSLGLELLAQMGGEQTPLCRAWELAATRDPSAPASRALAIAELAVASLLRARLIVLLHAVGPEAAPEMVREEDTAAALRASESWTAGQVWMRRA
jgi:hypothetical protein